jgi:heat shock protein 4
MQCAVLSPKFQVQREFKVRDLTQNGITITYSQKGDDSMDIDTPEVSEIFTPGNVVPSTKMMTFKIPERIEITADYSEAADIPSLPGRRIGKFFVEKGSLAKDGKVVSASVKVRVRLDENTLFVVDSATLEEEIEIVEEKKVEKKPEEKKPEEAKPADGAAASEDVVMKDAAAEAPAPEVEKVVTKTSRRTALKITTDVPASITTQQITAAIEEEGKMAAHDQLIVDTAEAKNTLESYVYDFRPRVSEGGDLREYFAAADAEDFVSKLTSTEDWLYSEEGESALKSVYVSRFEELKKRGDFAVGLQFEHKHREDCVKSVQANVDYYRNWVSTVEEKYEHIGPEDRTKIKEKVIKLFQYFLFIF